MPMGDPGRSAARVLLVDDSMEYRIGLQMALREFPEQVRVVGEAGTVDEAKQQLLQLTPDVVLLDLHLPAQRWAKPAADNGLAVLRFIRELSAPPRVLMLSLFRAGADDLFRALKAGADGCVYKEDPNAEELVAAIQKVAAGQPVYTSTVADLMRSAFLEAHESGDRQPEILSTSEDTVLKDLGRGKSAEQIDRERDLHPGTAGDVARRVLDKLRAVEPPPAGSDVAPDAAPANPFTYGNPISEPERFFGRRHEVDQIFSRLRNREFESSSLVGERRIGKTSLLMYVEHPDVRAMHGVDPERYIFAHIDLQMLDVDVTPPRFWRWLFGQLARRCRDDSVRQIFERIQKMDALDSFALVDLFTSIDERHQYVVLLLDEFDRVTANENFKQDFFFTLRSLAIHHNLALVTASRRELIDLCHDDVRSSPFFNIFANINLRLMVEAEALEMLTRPLLGSGIAFTDDELRALFRLAGPHPYFLQMAGHFLFEAYRQRLAPTDRLAFITDEVREEASPHFQEYWSSSDDGEKITLAALALLEQREANENRYFVSQHLRNLYRRSEQSLVRLHNRGLVIADGGRFALLSTALTHWIQRELAADREEQSYEAWLASNRGTLERLSSHARKEIVEVLPRISGKYRDLFVQWASDPDNLMILVNLLKGTLGVH
jgi:DNA-binding NarL/FixJ family response regulator